MPLRLALFVMAWSGIVAAAEPGYLAEIQRFRRDREATLKAEDGYLALAGLFWLKEGVNRMGSDAASEILLPPSTPPQVGVIELHGGRVTARVGQQTRELVGESTGPDGFLAVGVLKLHLLHRGGRYAIRLRDPESEVRRKFTALRWYPIREDYLVSGEFHAYEKPRTLSITTILGYADPMASPGYLAFRIRGREYHLQPVLSGKQLFFIFRDRTSGRRTYPAGRFLYADLPRDGRVTLDFNKAYNPPCAFSPYTTCPLPPRQNHLPVSIEAGELNYVGK